MRPADEFELDLAIDLAIEAATECGVDEVVPWQAARSIVQWRGERGEKAWRKWDAVLVAATKQSRRTRRPVLAPPASTADLAERVKEAAAGVSATIVNGEVLLENGEHTGALPGRVARNTYYHAHNAQT